jgi:hypothetical protein
MTKHRVRPLFAKIKNTTNARPQTKRSTRRQTANSLPNSHLRSATPSPALFFTPIPSSEKTHFKPISKPFQTHLDRAHREEWTRVPTTSCRVARTNLFCACSPRSPLPTEAVISTTAGVRIRSSLKKGNRHRREGQASSATLWGRLDSHLCDGRRIRCMWCESRRVGDVAILCRHVTFR